MTSPESSRANAVPRVWIDTDVALGAPRGDVDDGFALAALLAAHRLGRVEIHGISTVFGNATAALSRLCVQEICRRTDVAVPIVPGGEAAGQTSAAAHAITLLEAGVEILCLGPLTNVAAACRRDPRVCERLKLRAVGGNLSSRGRFAPIWPFEFNFALDRESARFALSRNWRSLTLYPLDVVRLLTVDAAQLRHVAAASPLGSYLEEKSRRWLARSRWLRLRRAFPLWDLPAALDVAGVLEGERAERPLACGGQKLLASSRAFGCLVAFDSRSAWARFLTLLGSRSDSFLQR